MTTQELLTSLQAGLEYAQECLAVHDRDRGRTTPRNKRHAEEMTLDIAGLSGCINHIQRHFGSNVSLPQPKELDANARKRHLDACSRTPATQVIDDLRYEVLTLSNRLKQSEEQAQRLTQENQNLSKNYQDLNMGYQDLSATLNNTKGDLTIYKHQLTVARKDAENWKAVAIEHQKVSEDFKQLVQMAKTERDVARQDAKDWKNKYLSTEESLGQDIINLSQKLEDVAKKRDEAREALKDASNSITSIIDGNRSSGILPKHPVSVVALSMRTRLKGWGM